MRIIVLLGAIALAAGADSALLAKPNLNTVDLQSCATPGPTTTSRTGTFKVAHCICEKYVVVDGNPVCYFWDCRNHMHPNGSAPRG